MAERVGFEPTLEFPLNTLSKRAPSTTRPSLLGAAVYLNLPWSDSRLRGALLLLSDARFWKTAAKNEIVYYWRLAGL